MLNTPANSYLLLAAGCLGRVCRAANPSSHEQATPTPDTTTTPNTTTTPTTTPTTSSSITTATTTKFCY